MGEARPKPRSKWPASWMTKTCPSCGALPNRPCLNTNWDERQTPHKGRALDLPNDGPAKDAGPSSDDARRMREAIEADGVICSVCGCHVETCAADRRFGGTCGALR